MIEPRYLLIGYMLLMSLTLFAFMGSDKRRARRHGRRTPERTLFWLAALGGGIGGCIGMVAFRHKTKHTSFIVGMPLLTLLNFAVAYLLLHYAFPFIQTLLK